MNKMCTSARLRHSTTALRQIKSANSKSPRRLLSKGKIGKLKKSGLKFTLKSTKRLKEKSSLARSYLLGKTVNFMLTQKINTLQDAQDLDFITSKSHVVLDLSRGQPIFARHHNQPREIASLTKIFTCYTAILVIQKLGLDYSHKLKVSIRACQLGGTSARLMIGDTLSIQDLLYGMMLPSGNDAAFVLAEGLGKLLAMKTGVLQRYPQRIFLNHINKLLVELKIINTRINNPHGLSDFYNTSTAGDVACLCALAIKDQFFREIVSTESHTAFITNERIGLQRRLLWTNTNRLLQKNGYYGIKTGVTDTAGPCLATWFKHGEREYIVVLLKCRSLQARFTQTEHIINHLRQPHSVWYKTEHGNEVTATQLQ